MSDHPTEDLSDLTAIALERYEEGGNEALEELLARFPDEAEGIRRRVEALRTAGLLQRRTQEFPDRLGDYRIIRRLGAGGMGAVFLAEQETLGREVALKVIRPENLFFAGMRERFRREIEAVAKFRHPGIVQVIGTGEADGVPYLAMELLEGASLGEVLHELEGRAPDQLTGGDLWKIVSRNTEGSAETPPAELRLFHGSWSRIAFRLVLHVARALAHAHEHGILHRDIKPSNVMITVRGEVKLLDFGLARESGAQSMTRTGAMLGSLPYLAPELLEGGEATECSDVYALGITLYEILTLRNPFESTSHEHTRARILEARPQPVRQRYSGVGWDGETVCVTAIESDPTRRYATANALADDVENYLDLKSIQARRPGAGIRLRRWIQRHPARAILIAATALFVLGGPIAYGTIQAQAAEELRQANDRASRHLNSARRAVEEMLLEFADETLRDIPQLDSLRREVLEKALAFYEEMLSVEDDKSPVRKDVLRGLLHVSRIQQMIGDSADSEQHARRALALATVVHAENPSDLEANRELGVARQLLAHSLALQDKNTEAIALYELNATTTQELSAAHPSDEDLFARLISVRCELAQEHYKAGAQKLAAEEADETIELCNRRLEQFELNEDLARSKSRVLDMRSQVHLFGQDSEQGIKDAQAALDILAPFADVSTDQGLQTELAARYRSLAKTQSEQKQFEASNHNFDRAISIHQKLVDAHPDQINTSTDLANFYAQFALSLQVQRQFEQATEQLDRAVAIQESMLRRDPTRTNHKVALSQSLLQQSTIHLLSRRYEEALPPLKRGVELRRQLVITDPNSKRHHGHLGHALINLAQYEYRLGDKAVARDLIEESALNLRAAVTAFPDFKFFKSSFQAALLWAARLRIVAGEHESAVEALAEAVKSTQLSQTRLRRDKVFTPLRERPDFQALLDK